HQEHHSSTCALEENNVKAVRRSKEEKKLLRKQIKASHTLLKHEGIHTAPQPTRSLVVANGGLGNSVSREELSAALKEMGEMESLLMPPHKPYAFVTYRCEESALKAYTHLNGQKLQCGESSVMLYLAYVSSVTHEEEASVPLPEGLVLLEDFVSPEEEALLLAAVDWSSTNDDVTAQKALKHRRVKHYGFEFRYDNNNVDKDKPLPAGIPAECLPVLERCLRNGHINVMPDQLTVNQYESGQGIPPHVDTHSPFEDTILSLSLGAKTVMEFRHPDGRVVAVVLPGRSLLVMKGESRYVWTHGITPRKFDMVPACEQQSPDHVTPEPGTRSNLTLSKRGTRTSFTFRKIRLEPCRCAFTSACDSQGASSTPSPSTPPPPALPCCHADAARLEEEYVHRVYDAIASHFSSTRHSPWPRVCHFLSSLPPGSVLADVGCGNGKYLGVNPEMIVGCDRSSALVQICAERGFHAFVSDALNVPLRTASCDACISIAVIHHFSTEERRLAAVRELVRLLKPGGHALIYVWAFEQEYNKQRSKYLKDHNKEHHGKENLTKNTSEDRREPHGKSAMQNSGHLEEGYEPVDKKQDVGKVTDGKLSVHTNRTAFNTQDLLVPWHLKEGKKQGEEDHLTPVFHRYYHVFHQGELEQLCSQVDGVKVQSSYHDQGNWCVILEKD
uniref:tRNA (carboxymethyluridine(34)-5-O)-methyltransferase n=1 Tax=Oreochromis niloticus TaxID=8128 RepID=I3JBX6_ORENI